MTVTWLRSTTARPLAPMRKIPVAWELAPNRSQQKNRESYFINKLNQARLCTRSAGPIRIAASVGQTNVGEWFRLLQNISGSEQCLSRENTGFDADRELPMPNRVQSCKRRNGYRNRPRPQPVLLSQEFSNPALSVSFAA